MGENLPNFNGREGDDEAELWLTQIEKIFNVIEFPERLKVRYGIYVLVDDVESRWHTQLAIKYDNIHPNWNGFGKLFKNTYIPSMARERKMEFLELSQSGKTLLQ